MNKCPITGKMCLKFKAFSVTEIKNQKANSMAICDDCIHKIDEKNMIQQENKKEEKTPESKFCCTFCGMSLEELIKNSKVGCEKCYELFEKPLMFAFEKLQRQPEKEKKELRHTGKVPVSWKKNQASKTDPYDFFLELKDKMAASIEIEDYMLSAELKRIITGYESLLNKLNEFKNDPDQIALIRNQISEFIYLFREKESEK